MKIFIVEDDPVITQSLMEALDSWGYQSACVSDFDRVVETFANTAPQLVLMDVKLPRKNGFVLTQEIRKISTVPILFITSKSDSFSAVTAMDLGADDWITKPFDMDVLLAKIRAVLRRTYNYAGTSSLIEHEGLILKLDEGKVSYQEREIDLTRNEFLILQLLLEKRGKTVSRDDLMLKIWKSNDFIDENTLSVNVARLRKKLKEAGIGSLIHTKKGEGYAIEG